MNVYDAVYRKPTSRTKDMTGLVFGKLTVVRFVGFYLKNRTVWECLCECGTVCRSQGQNLRRGNNKSCGCTKRSHQMTKTPIYVAWACMLNRCASPNNTFYRRYGGRGITVCDRWKESFENFYSDMGPKPTLSHSIDRYPNGDGNYEPGNCRWATQIEQAANSRCAPLGCSLRFTCEHCGYSGLHDKLSDQYRACPACACINGPAVARNYTGRVE